MSVKEGPVSGGPQGEETVMAAVDGSEFVIADLATDEAWLSAPAGETSDLDGWR